jgi:DNA gyrase subunit A
VLPLDEGEKITAMVLAKQQEEETYLVMVTKLGTVKRLAMSTLDTNRKTGIRALTLDEGDQLIAVLQTSGNDRVVIATRHGQAICFDENDVRPMGREAAGVRGIKLEGEDVVIGAAVAEEGKTFLTVTENGYGKRTEFSEYRTQARGGKGMRNYNLTDRTGLVAGVTAVAENDDVMLIESGGVIIRMAVDGINVYKRDTQGVILMRVEDENRVIAIERTEKEEEEEE